jgi:hypothetical protein
MISIDKLRQVIAKKQYIWYENLPNIIAIRTKLQVPDAFNDVMCVVYKKNGVDVMFTAIVTTEPGTTYQKKLLNANGCWVMMPAQMVNAYKSGFHQGKTDHRCLRSVGKIYGLREDDKDGIILNDADEKASWQEGSLIGANIHGAVHKDKIDLTKTVGPWSAGCQVHERWSKKEEMMDICDQYKNVNNGLLTYTLLEEKDFE